MKSIYRALFLQLLLSGFAFGGDNAPNPYQVFAEEEPSLYPTQTNQSSRVQGDKIPDLSRRPSFLRPGSIPAEVRYAFATDALVTDAAIVLTNHFCTSAQDRTLCFGRRLVVQPGAWAWLKKAESLGKKSATQWEFIVPNGKTQDKFSGTVLRDPDELKQVEAFIREEVQIRGGGTIRALSSAEMAKWWVFISFDIQEPTLALETKDKKGLFVFGFWNKKVVVMDELNGLPNPKTNGQP